ncbi:MAG: hypothetical protein AAF292_16305 [Pseudomonadota bacterium]
MDGNQFDYARKVNLENAFEARLDERDTLIDRFARGEITLRQLKNRRKIISRNVDLMGSMISGKITDPKMFAFHSGEKTDRPMQIALLQVRQKGYRRELRYIDEDIAALTTHIQRTTGLVDAHH